MREIIRVFIFSSIGRKAVMALTGLGAIGFLFPHLGGNITIVGGEGYFNAYAHHLHSFPLLPLFEAGLAGMFLIHICYGVALTYMNWKARPIGYGMEQNAGGRTLSSGTMIYSGLVILTFILYHLWTVKLNPAIVQDQRRSPPHRQEHGRFRLDLPPLRHRGPLCGRENTEKLFRCHGCQYKTLVPGNTRQPDA